MRLSPQFLCRILSQTLLGLLVFVGVARGGVEQLTETEFRELAAELGPKVNLFRDIWKQNPKAEIYGGTSRDFLLWLKGEFREAQTKKEAKAIAQKLKARSVIDIREFIIKASDVDVVSESRLQIDANAFDVKRVDTIAPEIFDPKSPAGFDELHQGHIPAEKIRLGIKGIVENPGLGNGANEIYTGRLTAKFASADDFAKTTYAKLKLNHPVLLALRYVRLQAMNYLREHGDEAPRNVNALAPNLDQLSVSQAKEAIESAKTKGALDPYLKEPRFVKFVNGSIQKSFRSFSNNTAAHLLIKEFGIDGLASSYSEKIEPVNQYLFSQVRDQKVVAKTLKESGLTPDQIYEAPAKQFPDGFLYHGTKTDDTFRSILLQGALPSGDGMAGAGLYGVDEKNMKLAESRWGDKNLVVKFPVKPDAKIMDLRSPAGKLALKKWTLGKTVDYEGLAKAFGADILIYPYARSYAYVVKNSDALGKPEGVHKQVVSLKQFADNLKQEKDEKLKSLLLSSDLHADEKMLVSEEIVGRINTPARRSEILPSFRDRKIPEFHRSTLASLLLKENIPLDNEREFLAILLQANLSKKEKLAAIERAPWSEDKILRALKSLSPSDNLWAESIELFLDSKKYPGARALSATLIETADWKNLVTLAQTLPFSSDSKDEIALAFGKNLRANVPRLAALGKEGGKALEELANTGFWDRAPALHDEIFKDIMTKSKDDSLKNFAGSYLTSYEHAAHAWKSRVPLFRELLDGKERYQTQAILEDGIYRAPVFRNHPEMFLDLMAESYNEKHLHWMLGKDGYNWIDIPLVKKIAGSEKTSTGNLKSNWLKYKRENALKAAGTKKYAAKDPLQILREKEDLYLNHEQSAQYFKKLNVDESKWLDWMEADRPFEEKRLFVDHFLTHYPSPRAKDLVLALYEQEKNTKNKFHARHMLTDTFSKSYAWRKAFPETTIDILLNRDLNTEYLLNALMDSDFFKENPEQLKRVIRFEGRDFAKTIRIHLEYQPQMLAGMPTAPAEILAANPSLPDTTRAELQKMIEAVKLLPPTNCSAAYAKF